MPPLPPPSTGYAGAESPPPGAAPRRRRRWVLVLAGMITVIALMAATAAITYVLSSHTGANTTAQGTPGAVESAAPSAAPASSAAERASAKQQVCSVFYTSTFGQERAGLLVENGEPNVQMVLRKLGSVVAVEHAIAPATPNEVAAAARRYIDAQLDLITPTMGQASADELNRLIEAANSATYALADLCGFEH